MKKIIFNLCLLLIASGCATLTKNQIKVVNQFGQTTTNFSDYPSKILEELAEIRKERGLYYAASFNDSKRRIAELDSIYSQMKFDYKASQKVDVTFKVIDKYAQSLVVLSSDEDTKYLMEQINKFGIGIDSLLTLYYSIESTQKIPTGFGNAIGNLIQFAGKQYIRTKQAKEIKKFVTQADTLISIMTINLLDFLESSNIIDLINNEKRMITQDYLSYIRSEQNSSIESQREYLNLKYRIDETYKLHEKTIKATKELRKSHKRLLSVISEKKKLKDWVSEIQILYEDVDQMRSAIAAIDAIKNN